MAAAAAGSGDSKPTIPKIKLAGIDKEITVLGFGSWQLADPTETYAKQSQEAYNEIVKAVLDAGIK